MIKARRLSLNIFLILLSANSINAAEIPLLGQPIAKLGSCPNRYYSSGDYCLPSSANSTFAITKNGACPSGYYSSGNYCLASSNKSKFAIQKSGSCPSGYFSSGNYCLSNR